MKLSKAIEILEHPPFYPSTPSDKDYADAIKLGIESLKSVRAGRRVGLHYEAKLLPGETEE